MARRAVTGSLVWAVGMFAAVAAVGCGSGTDALKGSDAGNTSNVSTCARAVDNLKCDGNTVAHCLCTKNGPPNGIDLTGATTYSCLAENWVDDDTACAVACDATVNPTSGCIASTQPIPECAQDGITCWNGDLTYCLNGYPLPTTACSDGTQCTLVPGCQALCLSPSATTDPRCPAAPGLSNDFCADNVAYHCACGYLIGTEACPDAAPCVTVPASDPWDHATGPFATCGLPP
jgi:hypothetical protein